MNSDMVSADYCLPAGRDGSFSPAGTSGLPSRARYLRLKGLELPVLRKYLVPAVSAVTVNLSAWWPIRGHSACPHGKHFSCGDKHSLVAICYSCRQKQHIGRRDRCRRPLRHAGKRPSGSAHSSPATTRAWHSLRERKTSQSNH